MIKRNRLIALVLALTFVFAMLISAFFVIVEADHDCTGEDCQICCQINVCENTLHSFGCVFAAVMVSVFLGILNFIIPVWLNKQEYNSSPVSLKVKLLN